MWTTPIGTLRTTVHALHHRARPCPCANTDYNYLVNQLLHNTEELPNTEYLTQFIQQHKIDTQFLIHLQTVEEAANDPEQQQKLWWLGSRLTVLLEGLDTASYEEVVKALEDGVDGGGDDGDDNKPSAIALRQQSLQQLAPEGLAFLEQQVMALRESMNERKMTSTTALLGRTEQQPQGVEAVAAADAAARILDYLLSLDDAEARAAQLPDAFSAGDGDVADDDDEQEQLSTTPLLLLQAIERRMRGTGAEDGMVVGEGEAVQLALEELRRDVLEFVLGKGL